LSLAFGVTLVSSLWQGTEYAWVFALPGIAFCVGAVRALRGASLRFEADHVEVRTMWRTRRVPRDSVAGFGITRGSNAFGLPWRVPYVKPASGPLVTQEEIRSLRTGTVVDRSVQLGNLWLTEGMTAGVRVP
jgi:hypothetical protein